MKMKMTLGEEIKMALQQAVEKPETVKVVSNGLEVKHLRKMLGMSQSQFAKTYGFSLSTVKKWEQGINSPDKSVKSYLKCIIKEPKYIANLVQST